MLQDPSLDKAMVALMLTLPSEAYLSEIATEIDVEAIHSGRNQVRTAVAQALAEDFCRVYADNLDDRAYSPSAEAVAGRSLKNIALSYWVKAAEVEGSSQALEACYRQFSTANNMTDVMAALSILVNSEGAAAEPLKAKALAEFYAKWQQEALVVNQWLLVQANCSLPGTLQTVKSLMQHPAFDIKNPNKVHSLIGVFCNNNAINFHCADGAGYEFLLDNILTLNQLNPQIAARLLTPLTKWKKYDSQRQRLMKQALERLLASEGLSKDVYEVVTKSLH